MFKFKKKQHSRLKYINAPRHFRRLRFLICKLFGHKSRLAVIQDRVFRTSGDVIVDQFTVESKKTICRRCALQLEPTTKKNILRIV
jgi:hypothetical protein